MPTPRTPTHLKKLRGTYVPTQDPGEATEAPGALSLKTCPQFLSDRQRQIWNHVIKSSPQGLLRRMDRDLVAAWVLACDRLREATRQLAAAPKPAARREWRREQSESTRLMVALSASLGFSPTARQRIKAEPAKPATNATDPWGELQVIAGGKG